MGILTAARAGIAQVARAIPATSLVKKAVISVLRYRPDRGTFSIPRNMGVPAHASDQDAETTRGNPHKFAEPHRAHGRDGCVTNVLRASGTGFQPVRKPLARNSMGRLPMPHHCTRNAFSSIGPL